MKSLQITAARRELSDALLDQELAVIALQHALNKTRLAFNAVTAVLNEIAAKPNEAEL